MDQNTGGDKFWLLLIPSWILSSFFFVVFLCNNGIFPQNPSNKYDLVYLVISLGLFLTPFISRIKIGKLLEFERELKQTKDNIELFKNDTRQMFGVFSAMASATANNTVNISTAYASAVSKK